jgi:hypothetical protein
MDAYLAEREHAYVSEQELQYSKKKNAYSCILGDRLVQVHKVDDASPCGVDGRIAHMLAGHRCLLVKRRPASPVGHLHTAIHRLQEHRLVLLSTWRKLENIVISAADQVRMDEGNLKLFLRHPGAGAAMEQHPSPSPPP